MIHLMQKWIDESIVNQLELQIEHGDLPFLEWNKGYLEALRDVHAVMVDFKIAELEVQKNA